jgi:hypothetical protein
MGFAAASPAEARLFTVFNNDWGNLLICLPLLSVPVIFCHFDVEAVYRARGEMH